MKMLKSHIKAIPNLIILLFQNKKAQQYENTTKKG